MDATLSKRKGSKHGLGISSISVFTNFSCGIGVLGTLQCSLLAEKLRNSFKHCGSGFGEIMAQIGGFRYPY